MPSATGTFDVVSMNEDVYQVADGEPKLTHASGDQKFTGDIIGEGSVHWLMCFVPAGGARFVGLQRVAGSLGGGTGSFVMESVGNHDGKSSKGSWTVIEGSGTGALTEIRGRGSFDAPGGRTVSYRLDYELG